MKVFVNIFAAVVLIVTIVAGKMYWDHQMSAEASSKSTSSSSASKAASGNWEDYAENLPKSVKEKLKKAETSGKPMKLLIVGSQATSTDSKAWPETLKETLNHTYGSLIETSVLEYKDETTLDFVRNQDYKDIIKEKPDVLLFEPFLLNDNGVVGITNTLDNLNVIMSHITEADKDLVTILQPSQPIYNATNYPKEAEALGEFAKENGYEYVNHWSAWPDYKSEKILDYLVEKQRVPTAKGNKAWASYLEKYFTAS
ncbi:SGNH/GDSL hydrolase family protein [Priestia megaterium]|uniref:SGNH/GDSL hydrolase family protein n=1 Tax=Priestia megaterium TaxID=1404 RepID=UPI0021AD15A4|nr:SGNH/GDSL hydrolase family protein [Priestia megaterium]MCR8929527.1 SGNH/GDSL hydrolase family protein [Priestia megaterium]